VFGLVPTAKKWLPIKFWSLFGLLPTFGCQWASTPSSHIFLPNSWPNDLRYLLVKKLTEVDSLVKKLASQLLPTVGRARLGINHTHPNTSYMLWVTCSAYRMASLL
jgi:hypothetical protein